MDGERLSIWQQAQRRGCSRREFLTFCGWAAAAAGVGASGLPQVVKALDTKPRLPVLWFHFQECTCCSESFLKSTNPTMSDLLFDMISLDYSETLQVAAGHRAEEALERTAAAHKGEYLMLIEGSVPTGEGGAYCCIGGRTALEILREKARHAKAIIAWGNCATYGCVQAARPNPTGAAAARDVLVGRRIVNVPGCPPIANVMAGTVAYLLSFDELPPLDAEGRPKSYYSKYVHDECPRLPHYEASRFVFGFGDGNAQKGHCLYKLGCRGRETHNACGVLRWNGGIGCDLVAGHVCIGCAEAGFWDRGSFYEQQGSPWSPGTGTVAALGGVVAGGVGVSLASRLLAARRASPDRRPAPRPDTTSSSSGQGA